MENVPASKVSKDKKNCQPLFVDEVATTVVEGDKGVQVAVDVDGLRFLVGMKKGAGFWGLLDSQFNVLFIISRNFIWSIQLQTVDVAFCVQFDSMESQDKK